MRMHATKNNGPDIIRIIWKDFHLYIYNMDLKFIVTSLGNAEWVS